MGDHRANSGMINYTPEQVEWMSNLYNQTPSRQTVEDIANILEKSVKSVIGKLAREGIYQKAEYKSKTGEKPITKLQIVSNPFFISIVNKNRLIVWDYNDNPFQFSIMPNWI